MHSVIARAKSRLLHHIEHRSYDVNHTDIPSLCVHTSCDRCAASTLPDDEDILRVWMQHRAHDAERAVHREEGHTALGVAGNKECVVCQVRRAPIRIRGQVKKGYSRPAKEGCIGSNQDEI